MKKKIYPFEFDGKIFKTPKEFYEYCGIKDNLTKCRCCGKDIRKYNKYKYYCGQGCENNHRFEMIKPKEWIKMKIKIRKIYNYKCAICKKEGKHVHHVKPISSGGNNEIKNLILLCEKCHYKEHVRLRKMEEITHGKKKK